MLHLFLKKGKLSPSSRHMVCAPFGRFVFTAFTAMDVHLFLATFGACRSALSDATLRFDLALSVRRRHAPKVAKNSHHHLRQLRDLLAHAVHSVGQWLPALCCGTVTVARHSWDRQSGSATRVKELSKRGVLDARGACHVLQPPHTHKFGRSHSSLPVNERLVRRASYISPRSKGANAVLKVSGAHACERVAG